MSHLCSMLEVWEGRQALSVLARAAVDHEPTTDVRVPVWLGDVVSCVVRRWGVPAEVVAVWLLAEGCSRLLAAVEANLLDWWDSGVPELDFRGPVGSDDSRQLRVRVLSGELRVALGWLVTELGRHPPGYWGDSCRLGSGQVGQRRRRPRLPDPAYQRRHRPGIVS